MDLISAKVEAASQSKTTKKKMYVNLLSDGETEVSDKAGKEVLNVYVNGSEVLQEEQAAEVKVPQKKTKTTKKMESTVKKSVKKSAPKKAVSKVAKKETAKKVKPAAKILKPVAGQKSLTIKAIREQVKKGFYARREDGKNLSPKYLQRMADQERKMLVTFVPKTAE